VPWRSARRRSLRFSARGSSAHDTPLPARWPHGLKTACALLPPQQMQIDAVWNASLPCSARTGTQSRIVGGRVQPGLARINLLDGQRFARQVAAQTIALPPPRAPDHPACSRRYLLAPKCSEGERCVMPQLRLATPAPSSAQPLAGASAELPGDLAQPVAEAAGSTISDQPNLDTQQPGIEALSPGAHAPHHHWFIAQFEANP
jgi:hypothetical protein